jgi:hypothetical protein
LDRDHFLNNEGGPTGGAALIEATAGGRPIVVTNSTFGDGTAAGANRANSVGALVALTHDGGPSVKIAGNEFRRNVSNNGAGAAYVLAARPGTSVTVNGNRFSDNRAGANGGGALIAGHTVTVARNIFVANRIHADQYEDAFGGGLAVDSLAGRGTLTQAGNRFDGNRITRGSQAHFEDGGAGESIHGYDVTSRNDRFTRNSLTAPAGDGRALGGGLEIVGCAPYPAPPAPLAARLENAVVAGNSTGPGTHGAGIFASGCGDAWTVLDSTIAGNSTSGAGATAGLSGNLDDRLTMRNSILVRNPGGPDVTGFGGGRTITRSDVCSPGPSPGPIVGAGNICADPRLIDARSGNVHETVFSRTINRGRNADIPAGLKTDYEGDPRVLLGRVDMGADEYRDPFAGVAIADQAVTVENGTAEVLVRCPANARTPCAGTLKLMRSGKEMGRGDFSIKRAKHARVAVHLNQRGRDALADHGTLEVFARATATDGFGTSRKRAAKVTLKG